MEKILMLIILLTYSITWGQENKYAPIDYPNSPDVSKMQVYGQIPVSTYSGLANVSVPVYTINEDGLEFPITLNYNTRGIKVNEESSRVGLGWSLGFPGLISRSMIGQDDLQGGQGQTNGKYFNSKAIDGKTLVPDLLGYFAIPTDYLKLGLDTRLWPTDYKLEKYIAGDRVKDNVDFQPDDYYYNLPATSGRFIFKRNKTAILENTQDNLKVEILDSLNIYHLNRFKMKVTDKIGNSYYFNDIESYYNQGIPSGFVDNAWYVSKIITSKGKEIEFTYDDLYSTPSYNLYDYYGMPISLYNDCNDGTSSCGNFPFGEKKIFEGLKSFKSKLIKKITFSSGYIEFTYDTREDIYKDKKITSIRIFDNKNKLIKGINLNHDYFIANYTSLFTELGEWQQDQEGVYNNREEYLKKRLKLNSIDYLDKENKIINSEKFEYYEDYIPTKNSTAVDIWGYFNGQTNNENLFPSFSITVPEAFGNRKGNFLSHEIISWSNSETTLQIPGANRNVNPLFTKMMTLKKITYPTKGYTEFEYENNTYDPKKSFVSDNNARKISFFQNNNTNGNLYNYAGGLRIKSTLNNDNNKSYKKTYVYHYITDDNNDSVNEYKSYGYLLDRPNLFDLRKFRSLVDNNQDVNGQHGYILIRNMPIYKNDFLGYENVEEITENIKTKEQIKKKFNYYISPSLVYNVFALGKGFETPRPNFREPDNVKMREAYKNYNVFRLRPYRYDYPDFSYYRDYSFDYKPIEVRNDIYPLNGLLKSTLSYIYENNKFSLLSEDNYNYDAFQKDLIWGCIYGHAVNYINSNQHINDFAYFNPLPFYNPYTTEVANTQGYPFFNVYNLIYKAIVPVYNPGPTSIIKKEYINGTSLVTKTENSYVHDSNIGKGNVLTTIINFPDGTNQSTSYAYAQEKGNQFLLDKNIVGIPLQTITTKTINGITNPLSDVDTKYPISQTEANAKTIGLALPYEVVSKDLLGNSNTEVKYSKYDNKGKIQEYILKPDVNGNGTPVVIIWGYNQTQPIAKIEGATYSQVMQAFSLSTTDVSSYLGLDIVKKSDLDIDENSEQNLLVALDDFRNNTAFKDFRITTYTYNPLIGVTSITSPNGMKEFYKYNSQNKLEKVLDADGNILKEYKYQYKQ